MPAAIELDKLLNLALGSPEIGAVNFNVLHGVLSEILKTLGVEKKVVEVRDDGDFKYAYGLSSVGNLATESLTERVSNAKWSYNKKKPLSPNALNGLEARELEKKVASLENRLSVLDDLPNNTEILKRAREKKEGKTPVGDIWQFININRRLSATETAIEKLSSLLEHTISQLGAVQDLQNDLSNMKKSMSDMEESNNKLMERIHTLEDSDSKEEIKKITKLHDDLGSLQSKVDSLPTKKDIKDLDICIKWPQFESALKYGSSGLDSKHINSNALKSNPECGGPKPDVLDTIKQIGDVVDGHGKLINDIQDLQETMPTKADKQDVDELKKKPEELIAQLNGLKTHVQNMMDWKDEMVNKTIEDLNHVNRSLKEFQENLERLNVSTRNLTEEGNRKQKHIDKLYSVTENLQENKADKDTLAMEMDTKADRLALDNMISRLKFDTTFGALEQSIQNLLNKLNRQESALQEAVSKLNTEVDSKLDRLEIDPLKEYINKRIKANKCKHVDVHVTTEDSAAGMTKPATKFHCISCARPVEVQPGLNAIPLPQYPGFPPSKSNRPYAPYELEYMRQQTRGNCEVSDQTSTRPCGGLHTITYPTRRVNKSNQYYYKDEEEVIVPLREETAIQGHDGQLYKGRMDEFNEQLPTLQQTQQPSQTSPKSPPRPPVVMSNPQTSPRSQTPVRPRSAVIR